MKASLKSKSSDIFKKKSYSNIIFCEFVHFSNTIKMVLFSKIIKWANGSFHICYIQTNTIAQRLIGSQYGMEQKHLHITHLFS